MRAASRGRTAATLLAMLVLGTTRTTERRAAYRTNRVCWAKPRPRTLADRSHSLGARKWLALRRRVQRLRPAKRKLTLLAATSLPASPVSASRRNSQDGVTV